MQEPATHYRTCNLCEAMCGLTIRHVGSNIISIKGDPDDPFSKGYICPKATALEDIYSDPDRLKSPVKRIGDNWEKISWKEAFDIVEHGLKSVQKKGGRDAVAIYLGNPNVHNIGSMLFGSGFYKTLRTKNRYTATSVDQLPHHFAAQMMFGHSLLLPIPDIDHTMFFLVLGANPVVSNGSIMSAAGMRDRIKALQSRGGKLVVIDPRKTETAKKADIHMYIRPGHDVYFLAAMLLHILSKEEWDRIPKWTKRLDELRTAVAPFTLERVAGITGLVIDEMREIIEQYIAAPTAVIYGRIGVSTQQYGSLCKWLINAINIVTGNFDRAGGAMFPTPAIDIVAQNKKGTLHKYNRWQSRVRGLPEIDDELPVSTLAEDSLAEGEGQIKALVCVAGNPVLSTPNGRQLEKAIEKMDFVVGIDIYINETTRFANVILPPATGIETSHYDLAFNALAVRNTAKYTGPLFNKEKGALYDWEIFKELTKRFQKKVTLFQKLLFKYLTVERMLNAGLKRGPYRISLSKLKRHPHGIDLGALQAQLPERLYTKDKLVDLAPELFTRELEKTLVPTSNRADGELLLIGRRNLRSNNSWMHNSARLVKGPNRCTVLMHPDDAHKRNIAHGDQIKIRSIQTRQEIEIQCEISDEIMPGVISIPHGWGHNRKGTRWKIAEKHAGVSINDITDDQNLDTLSGNAAFNGVPVLIDT
jgi:anaerobic selenocysteine-containing dehydrogenase